MIDCSVGEGVMAQAVQVEQEYFVLNSGRRIPAVGLGTWKAAPNVVRDAVCTALVDVRSRAFSLVYMFFLLNSYGH